MIQASHRPPSRQSLSLIDHSAASASHPNVNISRPGFTKDLFTKLHELVRFPTRFNQSDSDGTASEQKLIGRALGQLLVKDEVSQRNAKGLFTYNKDSYNPRTVISNAKDLIAGILQSLKPSDKDSVHVNQAKHALTTSLSI